MKAVLEQRPDRLPISIACQALGLNRSTVYAHRKRRLTDPPARTSRRACVQPRALSPAQRQEVLDVLHSEEFCDQPPFEVYAELLERGRYLCSPSSMHRYLRAEGCSGERRNQRPAQHHAVPRLEATGPNQVWTWDISKLPLTTRGVYLSLYVILDLFSRFALAWMVSRKENSALAQQLVTEASSRYRIEAGQLTLHQDRGSPMIAHGFLDLLGDHGITGSHSRPRVSNDNPFSESQFKTAKYQPDYPGRFDSIAHARRWFDSYFQWYNFKHHHSALAGFTPEQVFTGRYRQLAATRQAALDAIYYEHPERFVAGRPQTSLPPSVVAINPVTPEDIDRGISTAVNFPTLPAARHTARESTLILK
ncbi:MAG: IS3 family transposase [Gammaproteobacteria bacterium HGW-Gammaproteobacteria-5]|nr:MAG: IS3 family transposase [Gammaproteobacteria bacterium HGW-Gammaproteobacteria-5]